MSHGLMNNLVFDELDKEIKDPTYIEVRKMIGTFKKHKTPVIDGITTELIHKAGPTLWNRIYILIKQERKKKMPTDCRTGLIFPIHKKGSKDKCENYRGIILLPQMYKILSSVLYSRVVRYAEMTLGDCQCGFRSGRGTADNIFILRQIINKANEYKINMHVLFVDLKQAFCLH
jgi:hypothetical protein